MATRDKLIHPLTRFPSPEVPRTALMFGGDPPGRSCPPPRLIGWSHLPTRRCVQTRLCVHMCACACVCASGWRTCVPDVAAILRQILRGGPLFSDAGYERRAIAQFYVDVSNILTSSSIWRPQSKVSWEAERGWAGLTGPLCAAGCYHTMIIYSTSSHA